MTHAQPCPAWLYTTGELSSCRQVLHVSAHPSLVDHYGFKGLSEQGAGVTPWDVEHASHGAAFASKRVPRTHARSFSVT